MSDLVLFLGHPPRRWTTLHLTAGCDRAWPAADQKEPITLKLVAVPTVLVLLATVFDAISAFAPRMPKGADDAVALTMPPGPASPEMP